MTAVVDVVVEAGEARAVEQMVCTRGSGKGSGADGVYTGLRQGQWSRRCVHGAPALSGDLEEPECLPASPRYWVTASAPASQILSRIPLL